ncbi:hypothetical protein [Hydrogenophaga sp.]|uniref:hypothetical protein n=1 Tax=Hydrogenophaga sp. TaxID=1904254 RepID=UPI0027248A3F|nr:hypothetical protein [Hydrogenophaga sp.]MDO9434248.1 hypothetical protein [Hydrogenophaga sp.]
MSDQHEPTPSQKAVRDLYATGEDITALIAKYRDQLAEIADHFKSYRSLERFVATNYVDEEDDDVPNSRGQLSSLLRAINNHMQEQLEKMARTALALQLEVEAAKKQPPDGLS